MKKGKKGAKIRILMDAEREGTRTESLNSLMRVATDEAEVYSPPIVMRVASRFGLVIGEAMGLLAGYDFTLEKYRDAAIMYIDRVMPKLVIGDW